MKGFLLVLALTTGVTLGAAPVVLGDMGFEIIPCGEWFPDARGDVACYQASGVTIEAFQAAVTAASSTVVAWESQVLAAGGPVVLTRAHATLRGEAVEVFYFPLTGVAAFAR